MSDRKEAELKVEAWSVWANAYYTRIDPKMFPRKFTDLIENKTQPSGRVQSWQQIKQIALIWNAALGGDEIKKS